jgi:rhamnosyltransferase
MSHSSRVVAVVPVYFPDRDLAARLSFLSAQVDAVIVVDDGTDEAAADASLDGLPGIELIRHASNRGIAAALNSGVTVALDGGAEFVVTVDQDTLLPDGYVAACLKVFAVAESSSVRVGVVAAGSINGAPVLPHATVDGLGLMRYAIQSGMVISAECFRVCGLFDERLVIDVVDTEFCLRVWQHGMVVAAALGTDIDHQLGTPVPARFFGIPRFRDGVEKTYEYHAPFRQYYISRNGVAVAARYLRAEPRWSLSALRNDAVNFSVGFVAGPHRGRHTLAAALGVVHGVTRRRGKLSPWWTRRLAVDSPRQA